MYHPMQEMAQLPKVPQIENGKPNFSSTFQKVELRNLTFFQLLLFCFFGFTASAKILSLYL